MFDVQVYRVRLFFLAPDYQVKEGTCTYTFEPPAKVPFSVNIELPAVLKELIEVGDRAKGALVVFETRTIQELTIQKELSLGSLRKIYHGRGKSVPSGLTKLPSVLPDVPATIWRPAILVDGTVRVRFSQG